jgi:penicillin-binding protein 1A
VRAQFGLRADVAGKTGTTQKNTDGWFILMHPRLVAGSWVGFNDSRVTMRSNYWCEGAHNALLVVGDFFQQTLASRSIDSNAEFPRQTAGIDLGTAFRLCQRMVRWHLQRLAVRRNS